MHQRRHRLALILSRNTGVCHVALGKQLSGPRSAVEGGEKGCGMFHKPHRPPTQVLPTPTCIPYIFLRPVFLSYYSTAPQISWLGSLVLVSCEMGLLHFLAISPPTSCFDVLVSESHLPPRSLVEAGSKQSAASEKCPVARCGWTGGCFDSPPDCGDYKSRDYSGFSPSLCSQHPA